jgi:hypothetical protein
MAARAIAPSNSNARPGRFGPFPAPRTVPGIQGRHARRPLPDRPASGHSGTLQGAVGRTQTHSRRTGSKLGRLPRARQGLVPDPESNTKYGGEWGKPRADRPLWCGQVSASPRGFAKLKKSSRALPKPASPAVHRVTIYCSLMVALRRLRESTEASGQACPPANGAAPEEPPRCRRFPF